MAILNPITLSTSGAVFVDRPAAVLRISGEDAATFLQGQFTQELRGLAAGEARYGLWLNLKGKVLADSFVALGRDGVFWVLSYRSSGDIIRERLESHVIADDVTIESAAEGWGVATFYSAPEAEVRRRAGESGFVVASRRGPSGCFDWFFPSDGRELGNDLPSVSAAEAERIRIEAGLPSIPADVGSTDLPQEGGLERQTISFTKGCYLGQEVIARLSSMGTLRRRLLRVGGGGEAPATGTALFTAGRSIGEVRTVAATEAGWLGFAMVTLMHLVPDATVTLASVDGPVVRVVDPR